MIRGSPDFDPSEHDLEFQVLDWYIPEFDRSAQKLKRDAGWANEDWKKPADPYEIYMFGATHEGYSVCAKVNGFCPYFFVKLPDSWWKSKTTTELKRRVEELKYRIMNEKIERTKYKSSETYMTNIVPFRLRDHMEYMKIVWRKDFWGFTNGADFPFLKIRVKSLALFNSLKKFFEDENRAIDVKHKGKSQDDLNKLKFQLYESNIDPFLRFIHERDIQPCGWVRLPAGSYDPLEDEEGPLSRASINVQVQDKDVHALQLNKIAPLLIASFDIECTSSHGDFPVATKNYRKLAMDLLQFARTFPSDVTADRIQSLMLDAFEKEVDVGRGVVIHRLYPKVKLSRTRLSIMIDHAEVLPTLVDLLRDASRDVDGAEDDADDDGENPVAAFTNERRDKTITSMIDILGTFSEKTGKWKGVFPELMGDPLIQIGTTVHRYGTDEIVYRHIATLNSCAEIDGAVVETYETEDEVILGWKDFIQRLDPDILTGYNIFGFDMRYVHDRAVELGIEDQLMTGLGRLSKRRCILDERKLSSSALGDNIMHSFDLDGVVMIDMLKVMQRDHKLDSYKLDHVASVFLGDHKDDLKPKDIFEKFLGDAEDRCVIAKYCLQDCALINRLMHKLKVLENNVGMGNVCFVPLSYLFMRGQGVKIFSLVAKECRAKQYLIPVLRGFRDMDMDSEDGYEGAIVLEPKEGMYLEDPITVLDYSSLYPSSMIARNLSHDCFVNDEAYGNLQDQGITYLTVEYDVYEGVGDKKHIVGKKRCTFAQLPENKKGIIPSILMKLLQQRKNTRKKIEYERMYLKDGRVAMGLAKETDDGKIEILNVDQANLGEGFGGHKAVIAAEDVVKRESAFTSFEQAVLDALQLAYKITANSLYGQIGSRTSPIYWKDIAACTTATGREMIMLAKNFVETQYGAEVVYGDSVLPQTPVLVRNHETGTIEVRRIDEIGTDWQAYDAFKAYDSSRKEKQQSVARFDWEVWTDRGWSRIQRVIRHKCKKRIFLVAGKHGCVEVTEDHSLLDNNRKMIKPEEIKSTTELLHSFPELPELASEQEHIPAFYRFLEPQKAQAEYVHLKSLHCIVRTRAFLDKHRHPVYELHVESSDKVPSCDTSVYEMYAPGEYQGYVYDIETDEGVFQAGVGELIVKNTDSIFCKFPNNGLKGREALPVAIEYGQRTSREIKHLLPPPQCLEYEKTFFPFLLFSKKRYVGMLYEDDPNKKPKEKSMGIATKRRDYAPIVKDIYGGIIRILLTQSNLDASIQFLQQQLQELVDGKYALEKLIITKTLKAEYKDPTKIAHKVLAERMGERDPGNKPMVNDRIPFVYILPPPGVQVKLQGDRVEHPDYIRETGMTPDYRFYITNQLMNPICQLYALCVEKLPNYSFPPEYWLQMDEELKGTKVYGESEKKRKDRIQAVRAQIVEDLLFESYISQLQSCEIVKKKSVKKKAAGASTQAPSVPPSHFMVIETKEAKRGKKYDFKAVLKKDDVQVWEYAVTMEGTKVDCQIRGVQAILGSLVEQADATKDLICLEIKMDKTFIKLWKGAMKKADTLHEELQQTIATQDIGRLVVLQQTQKMLSLVQIQHDLPYVLEEA